MPVLIDAQIDRASSDAFFRAINRVSDEMGKSTLSAMQWAARQLCTNLAGQTKQVRKNTLRPVVQNPDNRWKTDRRRAPFGAMGYKDGKPHFIPIYKTGEFGKKRFFDKTSQSWLDRSDGSGNWRTIQIGPDIANPELIVPGIMQSPKRRIPHIGLAKKAWRSARSVVGRGGTKGADGVPGIASVFVDRNKHNPSITIRNKLRYARDAFKYGPSTVSTAMKIAGDQLILKMERNLIKAASKV